MKSYVLVALLLLKLVYAAYDEENTFDGFKQVRESLKGSLTAEFRELNSPALRRRPLSKTMPGHLQHKQQSKKSLGFDFLINNSTLDRLFAGLRLRFADKGPVTIPLPADQDEFNVMLFNKTMDGYISVHGGKIQGLESIHRTGDTKLDVKLLRGAATFTTTLGLNDLAAAYYGSLFLDGLGGDVGLDLSISHIELHVKIYAKIELLTMELEKLEVQELSFPQVGSFESHIKLTGVLDPIINMVLDSALNLILGEEIFESLAEILKELINDMLADTDVLLADTDVLLADTDVYSLSPYLNLHNYERK